MGNLGLSFAHICKTVTKLKFILFPRERGFLRAPLKDYFLFKDINLPLI